MPLTLYDAIIPSQLQILKSIRRFIGKAEAFCGEHDWGAIEILAARLAPDMTTPPDSFEGLATRIIDTISALQAISVDEMESFIGRDMRFVYGESHIDFNGRVRKKRNQAG